MGAMRKPKISQLLAVSDAHLDTAAMAWLLEDRLEVYPNVSLNKAALILDCDLDTHKLPTCLRNIVTRAEVLGCSFIWFSPDAPIFEDIPVHEFLATSVFEDERSG